MTLNGELLLSLKMEDKYALANIDAITKVPGIAWGENGALAIKRCRSCMVLEDYEARRRPGTEQRGYAGK